MNSETALCTSIFWLVIFGLYAYLFILWVVEARDKNLQRWFAVLFIGAIYLPYWYRHQYKDIKAAKKKELEGKKRAQGKFLLDDDTKTVTPPAPKTPQTQTDPEPKKSIFDD